MTACTAHSRVTLSKHTFQPSSDLSTGWQCDFTGAGCASQRIPTIKSNAPTPDRYCTSAPLASMNSSTPPPRRRCANSYGRHDSSYPPPPPLPPPPRYVLEGTVVAGGSNDRDGQSLSSLLLSPSTDPPDFDFVLYYGGSCLDFQRYH